LAGIVTEPIAAPPDTNCTFALVVSVKVVGAIRRPVIESLNASPTPTETNTESCTFTGGSQLATTPPPMSAQREKLPFTMYAVRDAELYPGAEATRSSPPSDIPAIAKSAVVDPAGITTLDGTLVLVPVRLRVTVSGAAMLLEPRLTTVALWYCPTARSK